MKLNYEKAKDYIIPRSELEKYLFYYNVQDEEQLAELLRTQFQLVLIITEN